MFDPCLGSYLSSSPTSGCPMVPHVETALEELGKGVLAHLAQPVNGEPNPGDVDLRLASGNSDFPW